MQPAPDSNFISLQPSASNSKMGSPLRPSSGRLLSTPPPTSAHFSPTAATEPLGSTVAVPTSMNFPELCSLFQSVSPIKPPSNLPSSIHSSSSPLLHPILPRQSILSAFPSTTSDLPYSPSQPIPPLISASAPVSPPNQIFPDTSGVRSFRGQNNRFQHAAPNGLIARLLRKAKGWLSWTVNRYSLQVCALFFRHI